MTGTEESFETQVAKEFNRMRAMIFALKHVNQFLLASFVSHGSMTQEDAAELCRKMRTSIAEDAKAQPCQAELLDEFVATTDWVMAAITEPFLPEDPAKN